MVSKQFVCRLGAVAAAVMLAASAQAGALLSMPTDPSVTGLPPVVVNANGTATVPFYTPKPDVGGGTQPLPVPMPAPGHVRKNILSLSQGDDASYTVSAGRGPIKFPEMLTALTESTSGLSGINGRVDFLEIGGSGGSSSMGSDMFSFMHQTVSDAHYCHVAQEIPNNAANVTALSAYGCSALGGTSTVLSAPSYLVVLVDAFDWTAGGPNTNPLLNLLSMLNDSVPTLLMLDNNGVPSDRFIVDPSQDPRMNLAWQVGQFDPGAGEAAFGRAQALSFQTAPPPNNVPEPGTASLIAAAGMAVYLASRRRRASSSTVASSKLG